MLIRTIIILAFAAMAAFSQTPPIEPGVSHDLAKWRAARYSDVRYKLNLTLEKMSPVLKGTMEIRVKVSEPPASAGGQTGGLGSTPIILDWRKIAGHEKDSTVANVSLNGKSISLSTNWPPANTGGSDNNEHLIFRDGVLMGENVIKLDFTSPILTSGSAITRYVDKEDGAEYIYSLFVPSDASTAFPVFDQPDLKARFTLTLNAPPDWKTVSNTKGVYKDMDAWVVPTQFEETKPISTYVFAFAVGPWTQVTKYTDWDEKKVMYAGTGGGNLSGSEGAPLKSNPAVPTGTLPTGRVSASDAGLPMHVYVRKSQATKFEPHAVETFRLTREGIKYLETYFDYKFPFPKYDLVLIPEFPFGGMEHAGATFLRESSVIFPTEPTKNDQISRANLIFHETAHQWFGDTVTMKWFDDLWLKEGFAEFMAYKTLEKVMPDANAWKVFYERNKQAAYLTDSTRGTTPIYQEIANLSAAKSAYGNIVYRKAPSFLRQAEYYLGEEKFQTAVRAFLKKHEYANAGWEDLVSEFSSASGQDMKEWGNVWVKRPGLPIFTTPKSSVTDKGKTVDLYPDIIQKDISGGDGKWPMKFRLLVRENGAADDIKEIVFGNGQSSAKIEPDEMRAAIKKLTKANDKFPSPSLIFPNYQDYGYGTFLLDDQSRDIVLKNIHYEKDDFLRTMMWGSLWDSVRAAELDPQDYVELVIGNLDLRMMIGPFGSQFVDVSEKDEGTIQSLLGRVSTAMNYYVSDAQRKELAPKVEALLIEKIQRAATPGQRITYYRAFLSIASTDRARNVLKQILKNGSAADSKFPLKSKDRFDIVTRLIILGDPEAPKLLADLEKTETGDDAKRYAYAAKAGAATAENKAKYWNDFLTNKDISESWIEAAMGPYNNIRHAALTQQYLERALAELPNLKRNRKIFFVNGWLGAFIGGQRDEKSLAIANKFLADNPNLDKDLRLKVLENVDLVERAVKIRNKYGRN